MREQTLAFCPSSVCQDSFTFLSTFVVSLTPSHVCVCCAQPCDFRVPRLRVAHAWWKLLLIACKDQPVRVDVWR